MIAWMRCKGFEAVDGRTTHNRHTHARMHANTLRIGEGGSIGSTLRPKKNRTTYSSHFSGDTVTSIVAQLVDFDPDLGVEDLLVLLNGDGHAVKLLLADLLQRALVVF